MRIEMGRPWIRATRASKKITWFNGEPRPRDSKGRTVDPGCICMSRGLHPPDTICPKHGNELRKADIPTRLGSKKFKVR